MRSSVDFWYLLISLRATVPGLYLWGFFTPPVAGADLRAALVASCLRGAFPPVDLRAVCLVRAIFSAGLCLMGSYFETEDKMIVTQYLMGKGSVASQVCIFPREMTL